MTEHELMLTSIRKCRRVDLYVDPKPLCEIEESRLQEMHRRRQVHEPLQYILGECEFMDLNLVVNEHVLIPRPETEILVEKVIDAIRAAALKNISILDMGTGSGNIALSLAKNISTCRVTAVDISQAALTLAKENAHRNDLSDKIHFVQSDLFSNLRQEQLTSFDIIVCNPPYIATQQLRNLPLDVQKEPFLALDGGCDGLDFYRRLAAEAPGFLKKGGLLFLEMGDGQNEAIIKIFQKNNLWSIEKVYNDYCHTKRVLEARLT